jgi:hypothetical protein
MWYIYIYIYGEKEKKQANSVKYIVPVDLSNLDVLSLVLIDNNLDNLNLSFMNKKNLNCSKNDRFNHSNMFEINLNS